MTSPFERALGDQLLAAAQRERRRGRHRLRAAAAAVATVLVAGIGGLVLSDTASAEVHVEIDDGFVEVLLTGPGSSPREILDALHEKGLDAVVASSATGPSNVGRFTSAVISGGDGREPVRPLQRTGSSFAGFRVPVGWSGQLELYVGRLAGPGEPYGAFTDPFAELEPLHCAGVLGQPLESVAEALEGLHVNIVVDGPQGPEAFLTIDEAIEATYGDYFVNKGTGDSADSVTLTLGATATDREEEC